MKPFITVSLVLASTLLTAVVQASEWSEVLKSMEAGKLKKSVVSCPLDAGNEQLCKKPMETLCAEDPNSTFDQVKNEIRKTVSKTNQGDAFDLQYQNVLKAKKTLDGFKKKQNSGLDDLLNNIVSDGKNGLTKKKVDPKVEKAKEEAAEALKKQELGAAKKYLEEQRKQIALVATTEKKILDRFGRSKVEISTFLESMRAVVMKQVSESPEFDLTSNEKEIHPTRDDIVKQLKSVKFELMSDVAGKPFPTDEVDIHQVGFQNEALLEMCATDGLIVNAFYSRATNTLMICPGFLLEYLNSSKGDLSALGTVLGHELGHSIDSAGEVLSYEDEKELQKKYPKATFDTATPNSSYLKFLACVDKNFASDNQEHFTKMSDYLTQLKNRGLPNLNREIARLQSVKPIDLDQIALLKRKILRVQDRLKEYGEYTESMKMNGQDPDKIIDVEKHELEADFESSSVLKDQLAKLPMDKRASSLKASLAFYCKTPEQEKIDRLILEGLNDPVHPPDQFRVENYFRNKDIRALLGCSPLTAADRPWCDLSGATH